MNSHSGKKKKVDVTFVLQCLVFILFIYFFYLSQYLYRNFQFSKASLNGVLIQHNTKIIVNIL